MVKVVDREEAVSPKPPPVHYSNTAASGVLSASPYTAVLLAAVTYVGTIIVKA